MALTVLFFDPNHRMITSQQDLSTQSIPGGKHLTACHRSSGKRRAGSSGNNSSWEKTGKWQRCQRIYRWKTTVFICFCGHFMGFTIDFVQKPEKTIVFWMTFRRVCSIKFLVLRGGVLQWFSCVFSAFLVAMNVWEKFLEGFLSWLNSGFVAKWFLLLSNHSSGIISWAKRSVKP